VKFTDIISPFLAWSRAARKVDTIPYPDRRNPGSERYRGFHRNDLEKCIGCGRCHDICQNQAIDMVRVDGTEMEKGDSGLRPLVDYGRCCWCALCVDVCSTGSLSMSNTYSWSTFSADTCTYVPGKEERSWDRSDSGYRQDNAVLGWAGSPRLAMPVLTPEERVKDFREVVEGYSDEEAMAEASRCIQCGLCVTACPAHMHIPEYLRAIAEGDNERAVKLFFDNNPLPEMCGRVCTRQCESVCAMGYQGEAIAIRWLKRFACERFESLSDVLGSGLEPAETGRGSVAVVGAGPAGLSAAYYLSRMGFQVHVYDGDDQGGGVAQHAIPEYRLPTEGYGKQMDVFLRAGVDFNYGVRITADDFTRLKLEHDAVFIAVGLQTSTDFRIPGIELPGVKHALYFLREDPEKGSHKPGRRVLVIGGGNVAMDTARTCRRLGCDVTISYRRRIVDMPADAEEIEESLEEGVQLLPQTIPERIERTDSGLRYVYFRARMVEDPEGGRPKPVKESETEYEIPADTIFLAIGQSSDLDFIPEEISRRMNIRWGQIQVDNHQHTGVDGIYAGGDVTPGAGDVISAVADGIRAAKAIACSL
jgi:glutamate synthase (NADPH/NADH) small chain